MPLSELPVFVHTVVVFFFHSCILGLTHLAVNSWQQLHIKYKSIKEAELLRDNDSKHPPIC